MGLFSISPVERFLDTVNSERIYTGTQLLVSGFLRAMQARNIYFQYGMHALMREAMKGMLRAGDSQRFGASGNLLSTIGDDEEMGRGDRKVVVEPLEVAAKTGATRMAKLAEITGVSRGISFGIDGEPSGPNNRWNVVIHRGPLPLLQIELSDITGFHPPGAWMESLIKSKCGHAVLQKRGGYLGSGHHLYLNLKRSKLFPYSKGNSSSEAVAAGQRLRHLCRGVWQRQSGEAEGLYELSSWQWSQKGFVRKFDHR